MRGWLASWYPGRDTAVDYTPMMRDLTGLRGDALDRAFLADMIPHHMGAVMMSQQLLGQGLAAHTELEPFARTVRDAQHAEIVQMRGWLADWFGATGMGPGGTGWGPVPGWGSADRRGPGSPAAPAGRRWRCPSERWCPVGAWWLRSSEEPVMAQTVLVVEDEVKIRELLRSYLERAGLDVVTTGSGAEAITLAARAEPDLIILDLRLPDVPGEDVAREVRRSGTMPILMLTAKSSQQDRIHGLEIGADDYVTKPFSPRELVLRVQAILRRGRGAAQSGRRSFGGGRARRRRGPPGGRGAGSNGRADPDRVGSAHRAGSLARAGLLALRPGEPGPRVRVRRIRAHRGLACEEPAPQAGT